MTAVLLKTGKKWIRVKKWYYSLSPKNNIENGQRTNMAENAYDG